MGYQAAWLEGRSYWSLVHPADVQGLRAAVARRKRTYIFKNELAEKLKPKEQRQEKERTRRVTGNTDLSVNADRDKSLITKQNARNMDKGRKT